MNYEDLYLLAEEFQQLTGCQLQNVEMRGDYKSGAKFALSFRMVGDSRWLILDLNAATPFAVCTKASHFSKEKKKHSRSPVENFINAHFNDQRLEKVEIAQKPNRTLRFIFSDD